MGLKSVLKDLYPSTDRYEFYKTFVLQDCPSCTLTLISFHEIHFET